MFKKISILVVIIISFVFIFWGINLSHRVGGRIGKYWKKKSEGLCNLKYDTKHFFKLLWESQNKDDSSNNPQDKKVYNAKVLILVSHVKVDQIHLKGLLIPEKTNFTLPEVSLNKKLPFKFNLNPKSCLISNVAFPENLKEEEKKFYLKLLLAFNFSYQQKESYMETEISGFGKVNRFYNLDPRQDHLILKRKPLLFKDDTNLKIIKGNAEILIKTGLNWFENIKVNQTLSFKSSNGGKILQNSTNLNREKNIKKSDMLLSLMKQETLLWTIKN